MSEQALIDEITELKLQNSKLAKINQVLMKRVEEGGGNQNEPYAAFEHSVHLAEQVKEKTQALNETLAQLERSNRALKLANEQANIFRQRFIDAIESISDAFVLLDSDGRIILQNSHFVNFWKKSGLRVEEGINLNDFKDLAKTRGVISQAYPGDADNSPVYKLSDNRWFQLNERRTREGGWVMLYTDITALKVAESERYEKAMAQKSKLLQNLVDNLSQGVILISSHDQVEVWNKRFVEMSKLSPHMLRSMPYFSNLKNSTELDLEPKSNNEDDYYVQSLSNGTVLEIRDHRLNNGKLIKTFTDITTRHRYAESLKKSESWLRLITDNVPAMIAYVGSDLKFQFTNQVYVDWYGWAKGELYGLELEQSRINGDFIQLQPFVDRALKGESVSFEIEELNSSGAPAHLLKSYVPNRDSTGTVLGFFVLVRDITLRRNNALALQKAHDLLDIRVKERTSQLQSLNDILQVEVEERRLAESNLTAAINEAEMANISKTKFLAAVSHDLLQPLNAAQLFTSSLSEQLSHKSASSLLGSISSSLDDLENLISTLVDISKLDAGVVKADKSTFNLGELLTNLANEYQQITEQFDVELHHVPLNAIVHTDSVLLARILRNFLSNAFRYTDKGKVLLGCRRQGDSISIQVWDNGAGIAKDQIKEIFKEFKRLKSSQKAFSNGLGLGLAIVDKLSKVLAHPIEVNSIEGKGSVFSVSVPLGKIDKMQQRNDNLSRALANTDLANRNVWLIDNDASICLAMSQLLNGWQCHVTTATSLEALVRKVDIKTEQADILIVDYHLDDDINGLDVAIEINESRDIALPILMITANYSEELKSKAKQRGILLLNKPVKPMKLKTSMLYLLK
ncbi:hybrid sensor histidine kinase/response regulator [Shewanella hanedai]|uniref:histidine kinase n=1 Tax=Shewanella hanedai TaxID=25 RepID=A0A553JJV9_SHEHA|nr:PAS domain-containing hybrid sensor histidine kinase/response regulator [Shewanella hanedai]TRY12708.1 PAS domain S-box protein [Shewanella hanedai]GGI94135.1 hybrid sensor histidine kinase/response regulator [Shewanella hanedai]